MTVHVLADVAIGDVEQFLQVFTIAGPPTFTVLEQLADLDG